MILTSPVQTVVNTGLCQGCANDSSASGGRSGGDHAWHNEVGAGERRTSSDATTLVTSRVALVSKLAKHGRSGAGFVGGVLPDLQLFCDNFSAYLYDKLNIGTHVQNWGLGGV